MFGVFNTGKKLKEIKGCYQKLNEVSVALEKALSDAESLFVNSLSEKEREIYLGVLGQEKGNKNSEMIGSIAENLRKFFKLGKRTGGTVIILIDLLLDVGGPLVEKALEYFSKNRKVLEAIAEKKRLFYEAHNAKIKALAEEKDRLEKAFKTLMESE